MEKSQIGQLQSTIKQPRNLFNSLILCMYLQIQLLKPQSKPCWGSAAAAFRQWLFIAHRLP